MKKLIIFFVFLIIPVSVFCQEPLPVPKGLADIVVNFIFWVSALAPLSGLTVFVTQTIITLFKITGKGLKQFISWITGFIFVVVLGLINIGIATDLYWYGVVAYGVAVSMAANKIFDVKLLEGLLLFFRLRKPKPVDPVPVTIVQV